MIVTRQSLTSLDTGAGFVACTGFVAGFVAGFVVGTVGGATVGVSALIRVKNSVFSFHKIKVF